MRRSMLLLCALAASLWCAGIASAEKRPNEAVLKRGLRLALASVRIGQMASRQAVSPHVRVLARQVVETNLEVARNLRALARQNGIDISGVISSADRRTERILQQTPGIAFDQSFLARAASLQEQNLQLIQRQILPTDVPVSGSTTSTASVIVITGSSSSSATSTAAATNGSSTVQQLATVTVPTLVETVNGTQQVAQTLTLALVGLQNGQCGFVVTGSSSSAGTTGATTAAATGATSSATTSGNTVGTVSTGTTGNVVISGASGTATGTTGNAIITGGTSTTGTTGTTVITSGTTTTGTTSTDIITGGVTNGTTIGTTVFSPATDVVSPATGAAVLVPAGTPGLPSTTAGVSTGNASGGAVFEGP